MTSSFGRNSSVRSMLFRDSTNETKYESEMLDVILEEVKGYSIVFSLSRSKPQLSNDRKKMM